MTSANGATYAGQYPCHGWVENLELADADLKNYLGTPYPFHAAVLTNLSGTTAAAPERL